jgi:hypothetical protein
VRDKLNGMGVKPTLIKTSKSWFLLANDSLPSLLSFV